MQREYVFRDFRFSEGRGLTRDGQSVPLQNVPTRCLVTLLDARGDVVKKDRLLSRVWAAGASDSSLTRAIYVLRRALEDDDGRVLQTVYGVGYRLNGTVALESPREATSVATTRHTDELVQAAFEHLGGRTAVALGFARQAIDRALALPPSPSLAYGAYIWLALVRRGAVSWTDADRGMQACISGALIAQPDQPLAIAIRGLRAAMIDGDSSRTRSDLDRARELDPESFRVLRVRSLAHQILGDLNAAIEDYDAAAQRAPLDPDVAAGRGQALLLAGRTTRALAELRAAAERWPNGDTVQASLAAVASECGLHDLAIASAERAAATAAGLPLFQAHHARALAAAGRKAAARAVLEAAMAAGEVPVPPTILALVELSMGNTARASQLAVVAMATDPVWRHLLARPQRSA